MERDRVQGYLIKIKNESDDYNNRLSDRIRGFTEPLHFAACHTLSKVTSYLPMPSENSACSSNLPCFESQRIEAELADVNQNMAQYLSKALNIVLEEIREVELKHGEDETNDLNISALPPMARTIQQFDNNAFNVEVDFPLNDQDIDQAFARDIEEAVERVSADDDMAAVFEAHSGNTQNRAITDHEDEPTPSTSSGGRLSVEPFSNRDQTQLRRQMVSVGK
jgi:hypothetical protein